MPHAPAPMRDDADDMLARLLDVLRQGLGGLAYGLIFVAFFAWLSARRAVGMEAGPVNETPTEGASHAAAAAQQRVLDELPSHAINCVDEHATTTLCEPRNEPRHGATVGCEPAATDTC